MRQEAVARNRGLVVPLLDLGSLSSLGKEFERRLIIICVQSYRLRHASQALTGDQAREAPITNEWPDGGGVLLLDPGLIILLVSPRACELEILFLAKALECLIA